MQENDDIKTVNGLRLEEGFVERWTRTYLNMGRPQAHSSRTLELSRADFAFFTLRLGGIIYLTIRVLGYD